MKKRVIGYAISSNAFGAALIALCLYLRKPALQNEVTEAFANLHVTGAILLSLLFAAFQIVALGAGAYYIISGAKMIFVVYKRDIKHYCNRFYYLQFINTVPLLAVILIDIATIGVAIDSPETSMPVAYIVFTTLFNLVCAALEIFTFLTYSELTKQDLTA